MGIKKNVKAVVVLAAVLLAVVSAAQVPKVDPDKQPVEPGTTAPPPTVPTVTFTWMTPTPPNAPSHHYSLAVQSTGRAAYESVGPLLPDATSGEPYMEKFEVTAPTRERIFQLAEQANDFQGDFDFKKHRLANSGTKTLAYADPHQQHTTTYNWSENPGIQELTKIFQGMVNTHEAARRMIYYRRYDKLGLEPELQRLEQLAKSGDAIELQSIAPLLQEIAQDSSVLHVARERAERLLKKAGGAPAETPAAQ